MSNNIRNECNPRQFELTPEDATRSRLWRPIHYLGSKLRLVEPIRELLADLDPTSGAICDLFAGSGTVSVALSRDRDVVSADIQEYSRVLCTALLQPAVLEDSTVELLIQTTEQNRQRLEDALEPVLEYEQRAIECASTKPTLLCDLVERGSVLTAQDGRDALAIAVKETSSRIEKQAHALMATRYFGGIYFSYRQTLYIDCVLGAIDELPPRFKDTCLAALLSTASSIVNSVGKQFAQPIRPRRKDGTIKQHILNQMCRDRCQDPGKVFTGWLARYRELPTRGSHRVIRGDYREVLDKLNEVAVIYADPPYTRDHYSRFYHVLETLCLRDSPDISTTFRGRAAPSRGHYRTDRHQSPFCIKSQAPGAFTELFAGARKLGVPLLLSYSPSAKGGHPRLMTVEAVVKLASEYYRQVEIVSAGRMAHSKLNKSELHLNASSDAEVLITCRV